MLTFAKLAKASAIQKVTEAGRQERDASVIGGDGAFARSKEHFRGDLKTQYHDHGRMDRRCETKACGAYFWPSEVAGQGKSHWKCCWRRKDKVWTQSLPSQESRMYDDDEQCAPCAPKEFGEFQASGKRGKDLYRRSREYSNSFALASAQLNYDNRVKQGGPISIQGRIHRYFPDAFTPPPGVDAAFAQMYFVGGDEQAERYANLREKTKMTQASMDFLHKHLSTYNPYVNGTECAALFVAGNPDAEFKIVYDSSRIPAWGCKGTFNKPSARNGTTGVAAILAESAEDRTYARGLVMQDSGTNATQTIPFDNRIFEALHSPLLLPTGAPGWDRLTTSVDGTNESVMQFYKSRLMQRFRADDGGRDPCDQPGYVTWDHNPRLITLQEHLFTSGRMFQEYVIDAYTKHLDSTCSWASNNQATLLSKVRSTTAQACAQAASTGDPLIGVKRTILPKSVTGSPADYKERYQNALKLIQMQGKPDLFITMTCNPQWPEIQRELLPGECWENRMDLVARVFSMKRTNLIDAIKAGAFGSKATAIVAVTEFQKKSLPHVHILVCLATKLTTVAQFDAVVCAEIPSADAPELRALVLKHMIHSPCEHDTSCPCRQGPSDDTGEPVTQKCGKFFPKPWQKATESDPTDSYPAYQRTAVSDGGETGHTPGTRNRPGVPVDNSWVVPYNPALLAMFDCHINVEVTSSIDCVKYLYKYVYKGNDRVMYKLRAANGLAGDQIEEYRAARYLTATEAFYCIFFPHQRFYMWPPVLPLTVHTAASHPVTLSPDDVDDPADLQEAIRTKLEEGPAPTHLTKYFEYCLDSKTASPEEVCHTLTYEQFPTHYKWETAPPGWAPRKTKEEQLGRMHRLTPSQGEDYYIRILLGATPGATGYDMLLDGADTYREACYNKNLISTTSDAHWDTALLNAVAADSDFQVRHLFVMILQHCLPAHPRALYDRHCERMAKPYLHTGAHNPAAARTHLLVELHRLMDNSSFGPDSERPIPDRPTAAETAAITQSKDQKHAAKRHADAHRLISADEDQERVYDRITRDIARASGGAYFLNAGGGCGKTTVMNCVLDWCIVQGHAALSTAMTGVAATLLERGTTFHSATGAFLKIPTKAKSFGAGAETVVAKKLRRCRFLFVDEATMMHKVLLDSLDMTLRGLVDAEHAELPFGGKTVVLSGDFRQQLPVTKHANPCEIIASCAVYAKCWSHIHTLTLETNHRLADSAANAEFATFIDRVGRGVHDIADGTETSVELPARILLDTKPGQEEGDRVDALIDWVYKTPPPSHADPAYLAKWLMSRRIVTPKNRTVDELNERIMDRFGGKQWTARSDDSMEHGEETAASAVSPEILHKQQPPGFPPHELRLQKGLPYMLTRNLDASLDLCNGTVVVVEDNDGMAVTVSVPGSRRITAGRTIRIPRILFIPGEDDCPFFFRRRQFPLQPAMACTINKVQGQSLERTGVYLPSGCFTHGQLYVALSRATDMNGIRVLVTDSKERTKTATENTVFRSVIKAALGESACSPHHDVHTPTRKRKRKALPDESGPVWTGNSFEDIEAFVGQWGMETIVIAALGFCGYIALSQQLGCSVPQTFDRLKRWAASGTNEAYDGSADVAGITAAGRAWDASLAKPMSRELSNTHLWFQIGWMFFCAKGASSPLILVSSVPSQADYEPTVTVWMPAPFDFKHTNDVVDETSYAVNVHPSDVATILADNDRCICLTFNGSHINAFGPVGSEADWKHAAATYDAHWSACSVVGAVAADSTNHPVPDVPVVNAVDQTAARPPVETGLPHSCPTCNKESTLRFDASKNRRKRPFSDHDVACSACNCTYAFCVPCSTLFPLPDRHLSRHVKKCSPPMPLPASMAVSCLACSEGSFWLCQPKYPRTIPSCHSASIHERDVVCSTCGTAHAACLGCNQLFRLPAHDLARHVRRCGTQHAMAPAGPSPRPADLALPCQDQQPELPVPTDSGLWHTATPLPEWNFGSFMQASTAAGDDGADDAPSDDLSETEAFSDTEMDAAVHRFFDTEATEDRADGN